MAHAAHRAAELSMRANDVDRARTRSSPPTSSPFWRRRSQKGRLGIWSFSDPPSFAPSRRPSPGRSPLTASFTARVPRCSPRTGILCAASCSSHRHREDFGATLDDIALDRTDLSIVGLFVVPLDHPTLAAWPEGRYLKFAVLR